MCSISLEVTIVFVSGLIGKKSVFPTTSIVPISKEVDFNLTISSVVLFVSIITLLTDFSNPINDTSSVYSPVLKLT